MEQLELKSTEHVFQRIGKPHINPYLGGVLLGIVLLMAYVFAGEGLGASGAVKNTIAWCAVKAAPASGGGSVFFSNAVKKLTEDPNRWWIVVEVVGVLVGGFISGAFSGRLKLRIEHSPRISSKRRLIFAFMGGVLFGIGAQFGRGCTSGAALSGMASLSVAGFLTMICIFGTGYAFAYLVRKNWI